MMEKPSCLKFLSENIQDKCIKAQFEGKWAQAIPLEDATAYSYLGSLKELVMIDVWKFK